MKTSKKVLSTLIALSLGIGSTALADIPNGTVVIGDKAYDVDYVNKKKNHKEIIDVMNRTGAVIYAKGFDGKWFEIMSEKEVSGDMMPMVTYKSVDGKLTDYAAGDGEVVELNVAHANFITSNKVIIRFNKKLLKESAVKKDNYSIGGIALKEKDSVSIQEDGQTIIITLSEKLEEKNMESKINVSGNLLDMNSNKMDEGFEKTVFVVNSSKALEDDQVKGDVNIIKDHYTISNMRVQGDIYVSADHVEISDTRVKGTILLDSAEGERQEIRSLNLTSVDADSMEIDGEDKVQVITRGETEIGKTLIKNNAVLRAVSGSFGEITVDIRKDTGVRAVELKGMYKEKIIIKSRVELTLGENTVVDKLVAEEHVNVTGHKSSKVKKVFADKKDVVTTEGVDVPEARPVADQDKGDTTPTPPPTPVVEKPVVDIKINGRKVTITVESEDMKESITIKIIESQSNKMVFIDQLKSQDNKVVFDTELDEAGEYTVIINAYGPGEGLIEKIINIEEE